jgi:hypothetical protein
VEFPNGKLSAYIGGRGAGYQDANTDVYERGSFLSTKQEAHLAVRLLLLKFRHHLLSTVELAAQPSRISNA